jgi:hypothetical protein
MAGSVGALAEGADYTGPDGLVTMSLAKSRTKRPNSHPKLARFCQGGKTTILNGRLKADFPFAPACVSILTDATTPAVRRRCERCILTRCAASCDW